MIEQLGRIRHPLGTINLDGETKLIVSPWAAMGTDALLIGTGIATASLAKHPIVKALGWAGTIWGGIALAFEAVKLLRGTTDVQVDIIRQ